MIRNKTKTVLAPLAVILTFTFGQPAPRAADKPVPAKKSNGPLFPFQENGMWASSMQGAT